MAAGVSAPKTLSQKWAHALVSARAARSGKKVATTPPARAPRTPFRACRREVGRASALVNSSNRVEFMLYSFEGYRTRCTWKRCQWSSGVAGVAASLALRGHQQWSPSFLHINLFLIYKTHCLNQFIH